MAVATHVSRVAKEYAPFGYSVMSDAFCTVGRLEGASNLASTIASNPVSIALLPVDDADVYIESVHLWVSAQVGTHDGTNHFKFFIKRGDNDGSLTNSVELVSAGSENSNEIPVKTLVNVGVDQNQVIPKGKVFYLHITEHGNVATLALDGLSVLVRYRRKA